jgi:exonuclease V gamma subunit
MFLVSFEPSRGPEEIGSGPTTLLHRGIAERPAEARERITEVIELAAHDILDIARSRAAEQDVLDLLDEPPTR